MDTKSLARILAGIASILALWGIEVPQEFLDITIDVVSAIVLWWAMFKNNYLTKKGKAQKDVLEKNMLD